MLGRLLVALRRAFQIGNGPFKSANYWDSRYASGGNSGSGSYGRLAEFKAQVLNELVDTRCLKSVIEHGCGDGAQLTLAKYPSYLGLDVSPLAVDICRKRFAGVPTMRFELTTQSSPLAHELAISLDVIYHLVEDDVYVDYMARLFDSATRMVVIYSSNSDKPGTAPHVRHRCFTDWVGRQRPDWVLTGRIVNPYAGDGRDGKSSFADFYIFEPKQLVAP